MLTRKWGPIITSANGLAQCCGADIPLQSAQLMSSRLPPEGLAVIAIEQAVAAQFATSGLADDEAPVIKVGRPNGDFARRYDHAVSGQSSYFVCMNWGKQSVALNLSWAERKAAPTALIAGADVVVQNRKPGARNRLAFAPEQLWAKQAHPKSIWIEG